MSGPIVRKYGFPNFEKIFGKRELEHGVEDAEKSEETTELAKPGAAAPDAGSVPDAKEPKPRGQGS